MPNQSQVRPEDKQRLDIMLPLRMDRMHVKALSDTWKIPCPQEEYGDEVGWPTSNPNLCLRTQCVAALASQSIERPPNYEWRYSQ